MISKLFSLALLIVLTAADKYRFQVTNITTGTPRSTPADDLFLAIGAVSGNKPLGSAIWDLIGGHFQGTYIAGGEWWREIEVEDPEANLTVAFGVMNVGDDRGGGFRDAEGIASNLSTNVLEVATIFSKYHEPVAAADAGYELYKVIAQNIPLLYCSGFVIDDIWDYTPEVLSRTLPILPGQKYSQDVKYRVIVERISTCSSSVYWLE